jgi:hypothetical protein
MKERGKGSKQERLQMRKEEGGVEESGREAYRR